MQLTPLALLTSQCASLTRRLEHLQENSPRPTEPMPFFAISGLASDLQRVYAIELILMHLERRTEVVQAEVADAIADLLETIGVTYSQPRRPASHPRKRRQKTGARRP